MISIVRGQPSLKDITLAVSLTAEIMVYTCILFMITLHDFHHNHVLYIQVTLCTHSKTIDCLTNIIIIAIYGRAHASINHALF